MPIQTLNPFSAEIEQTYKAMSPAQIAQATQQAAKGFEQWRNTSISERAQLLRNVSRELRQNKVEYARLMTREMGKLLREGVEWELPNCADMCDYYAENGEAFLANEDIHDITEGNAHIESHPIGVIFGVMPWNFPFYQVIRFIAPNVIAGNTVVFKHASNVPQCAIAIEKVFQKAGFPAGVVTNLLMNSKDAEQVIADPNVRAVSLTGSERAGSSVAALAGKHLKKVVLELGGSDAFIVTNDSDIKEIGEIAFNAKMFNCGEVCTGAKRYIVVADKYDEFLADFTARMKAVQPGDPMDMNSGYGPMVSEREAEQLYQTVQRAAEQGAQIHLGGERGEGVGAWLQPTIVTGVTKAMDIYSQELFGPVAMVFKVADNEAAIELANDSLYGLSSAIMCTDLDKAKQIASRLETGVSFINNMTISEPGLPFGGVKNSGFGRELGRAGLEEFLNKKLVRSY